MSQDSQPPAWMDKDRAPRGATRQTKSYIKANMGSRGPSSFTPSSDIHTPVSEATVFPQSVVTGVKIIASLMVLNTCIGAAFVLVSMFPPQGTEIVGSSGLVIGHEVTLDTYFSFWRMLITLIIGVAASMTIWKLVDER